MSIEQPFDPDERRREAMTEGSGVSNYLADARLSDESIPGTTELPRRPRAPHRSRPSGHVRGFHDGELRDGELYKSDEPLTPEQQARNNDWLTKIRKSMGDQAIQRIIDQVHEMIPIDPDNVTKSEADRERMITARLRTRFDRQK